MFKRIICLMMALFMVVGLTACKNNASDESDYSIYEEIIVEGGENNTSTSNTSSGKTTTVIKKEEIASTASGTGNKDSSTAKDPLSQYKGNAEKMKEKLDFKGKSITIMREWEPYKNGRNAAHDNFNNWVNKCEKRFNVKIVEKKWKATLAGEMLSGVKPEGHYYLVGANGGGSIYDMATKGYLAYMDDAMKETGIDMTADHYSEYNTGVSNVNGKQWTIGFGFARIASTIYYNKKLLAEAGYERTLTTDNSVQSYIDANKWNWDIMTEMAKKTTKRNNSGEVTQWGIGIGSQGIKAMILSNGGHVIHPNSKGKFVSHLNTENTKEAIQQVYDWYHVDKVANSFSGGQWTSMGDSFAQKKIAFIFGGHADGGRAYNNLTADDYGVAYLPMGPRMKKYVAFMTWEYSYVVPATYQDMTTELLLLADELHYWPVEGYTRDDEFRDEWTRYFHSAEQYNMWYNHHYSNKIQRVWDGSTVLGADVKFDTIINGTQTPAVWADTFHKSATTNTADLSKKYTYTGKLK